MIGSRIRDLKCDKVFAAKGAHIDNSLPVNHRMLQMVEDEIEKTAFIAEARSSGAPRIAEVSRSAMTRYAKSFTNIYFVICKATGAVKIGRADNVKNRLSSLQISTPNELAVLGYFRAPAVFEGVLHTIFASSRLRGEWFSITDDLLDLVEAGNDRNYIGVLAQCKMMLNRDKPVDHFNGSP